MALRKDPPIIFTKWGPVTEWARLQAVANMKADPVKFLEVKAIVIRQCGGNIARGEIEFQRRFPELFEDE